jgi:hypothetical protein
MNIPDRLAKLLERQQELDGTVKTAISRLEPWIKHSHLPFFPEYTDHGLEHLEQVLATASSLIRDEAWAVVTPSDAAVIILSVLVHDCAMHLSEDGFAALLQPPWRTRAIPNMGDRSWDVLWEEFLGEASRFDGKKLNSLFGDLAAVRRPSLDPAQMTKRDRLLIGEFLRRHHPRLAQEIVEFGVPGPPEASSLALGDLGKPGPLLPLAGIIARSHGEPIRLFLPLLEARYGKGGYREFRAVHPVFLMALLRVADYLQVHAERAPKQVLSVKRLVSPVSQREWSTHAAILDVRHTVEDPEALHVEARPPEVKSFFRVKDWVLGIQSELDESWAVLGEVYGRYAELAPLGLVLRRIRSNIHDTEGLVSQFDYIPRRAAFRAADADLLKLLIRPLYGDDPGIGMRELIQNAVDAVRELDVLLNDRNLKRPDIPLPSQGADVVAAITKDTSGQHWVEVSDCGVGMTVDVVIDYFLTAGASFRRSEDWRKSFETIEGKSRVLRAGRFGIGALAAFLLGNEIHVTTRHVDSSSGVAFSATVETEFVELKKHDRPVGTTIRIPVSKDIAERLSECEDSRRARIRRQEALAEIQSSDDEEPPREALVNQEDQKRSDWDWYCLACPSLKRVAFGRELEQEYTLQDDLESDANWRLVRHADYGGILWSYSKAPSLACNGIIIPRCDDREWTRTWGLNRPRLQVRDPDGNLPVNLQRSELQTRGFPFAEELGLDVARSFCAYALSKLPAGIDSLASALTSMPRIKSPYLPRGRLYGITEWLFSKDGVSFLDPELFRMTPCRALLIVRVGTNSGKHPHLKVPLLSSLAYMIGDRSENLYQLDNHLREVTTLPRGDYHWTNYWLNGRFESERVFSLLGEFNRTGTRVLLPKSAVDRYVHVKTAKKVWRAAKQIDWESNGWVLASFGSCDEPVFSFRDYVDASQPENDTDTISECYFEKKAESGSSRLAKEWLKVFGRPLIPFGPEERRVGLHAAYALLEPYMSAFREASADESERQ